ncbi:MAG: hypothetical protein A2358_03575 [Candidatus Staskawiczbacteria bacterium RIFOXYB1_FULL_37_44]|uniref:histidine kinase n=1 Tax=Candidatus Staskawiczbacteria bacterium RIFOXYB1_FULL_37_44 TaxID=1802223 RepID=A0A1G2IXD6_9BACT|nr:MAG: hypothetical protein A2358_03575 [Candidatus Staskawiczbacteria bacterium RIFOXYB1_FULL_37_44]OGZ84359.1 MAG: hypothetical protein A2416_01745 [Candidatus Staskawiczbacteria bacterium RIFOXYC1_FULL_37_52]OGZ89791.1 MAG: hypothetical protein A2581_00915 [Candidatus Staskawiczbacteria bacterium RIFOXYD1_FULL_37_110]
MPISVYFIVIIILAAPALVFFVKEKIRLEKAKKNLAGLLKNSEEERAKAEAERDITKTVVSSFTDGLIILDEKDNIFSINPEAVRILKLENNRLLGKSFSSLADFPKTKPIMEILEKGIQIIYRKEVELAKDFIIEFSVLSLGTLGNSSGHLIVLHDISRGKMVEKMEIEFVSLAAHQLRTPLSIIKWSISMLKKGDFGKLTAKQNELVKNTFRNNERLITLVNDLLNVTRIAEGRYLYKLAPSDIREIIRVVLDIFKDQMESRKIKLDFTEPENFPQIMLDAEKIKIVVQNFIDNAIKYSADGSKIAITLQNDGKNIELRVKDFGIGIPKGQQDKIFTKFFRGDNAMRANAVGSGLGLFLSKNIIESHGGVIWFESEENVGTSFCFTLPIKKT